MPEPIIKTVGLEVTYNIGQSNEYKALHGETLEIYPQEYIILFGPSGCGKSTLLYAILGALPPSGGDIRVKGENPYLYDAKRMVKFQQDTIGIIYQSFNLIASLNVLDNVALPMIFAGIHPAEREVRGMQLLKQFGVDHVAHKPAVMLSGGQSQRVAVARSLINDPEILLADEPVGNLDSHSAEQVMDMLADINRIGKKTVILVTHDAKYLPYAHRVFYVRDGRLEREVPNPEKTQIKRSTGKTVVTELEKLARIYPYDTQDDLRVKSILNYLTQEMTFEQLERLEKQVKLVLAGRINEATFCAALEVPVKRGGVGLTPMIAVEMTRKLLWVIGQSLEIKRYKRMEGSSEAAQRRVVQGLRMQLMDAYRPQITILQRDRVDDAVNARLSGIVRKEGFQKKLEQPIEEGGVGFDEALAHSVTVLLEKFLAQGTHG